MTHNPNTAVRLVIAEKPSVAMTIASVLGASTRHDGYMEGNGHLVSWCYGHLAGLADADFYNSDYAKWKKEDLPILPEPFRFLVSPDKKKQFDLLEKLMHRSDVAEVINACDAGREGELIFRSVYYLADCRKPMKRLWISSMEDEAIREGFNNLAPGEAYKGLYQSALCRAKADWLVGINASRFFTLTYGTKMNVGRVVSPTLALLVQRESEISAFTPETYYTVNLEFEGFTAVSEKFSHRDEADRLAILCHRGMAEVQKIEKKDKSETAPFLYDLTSLQRDANRLLGYTAQQTLDYTQGLYEKKLCTYPRTDSRFLSDDMIGSVKSLVLCAAGIGEVSAPSTILDQCICNSKKVTDHHGIIPTMAAGETDLSTLPVGERNILKLISRQLLIAVSEEYRYEEAVITVLCADTEFKATIKRVTQIGWKQYAPKKGGKKWFDGLHTGQKLIPVTETVKEDQTKPPRRYTEDLLLAAMETAGAKEMPKDAERKGLGTSATRAGILEKLVSVGLAERQKGKKQTHLIPTATGNALITVLPEQLQSPQLTAEWEYALGQIQNGNMEADDFMEGITEMVSDLIQNYVPTPGAEVIFPSVRKEVGKCPRCGSSVYENNRGFFCNNDGCRFALWKNSRFFSAKKKQLTTAIARELLEKGRVQLKGCYSPKSGITYDAAAVLEDDGKRTELRLVFDSK